MAKAKVSLRVNVRSRCVAARGWTICRSEYLDGPTFPIRLEWREPITGLEVWGYILQKQQSTDPEWNQYTDFEAWPTAEDQTEGKPTNDA